MDKLILLASGGIDSSTIIAKLHHENLRTPENRKELYIISFLYGQRHKIELEKLKDFLGDYDIKEHKIITLDTKIFTNSSLTNKEIDVPTYKKASDLGLDVPSTYVPARNTIFLSNALALAQIIKANEIYIGAHVTDYANYPDCRPEYLEAFEKMANIASSDLDLKIKIRAPLINMSKTEIVKYAKDLGVDFRKTISCYNPNEIGLSCASCHACLTRKEAFEKAHIKDVTEYII